jgi:hypothetical protein
MIPKVTWVETSPLSIWETRATVSASALAEAEG